MTYVTDSLRVQLNKALVDLNQYETLIKKIEYALIARLKEQGMVQTDEEVEVSGLLDDPVPPGEPIEFPDTDPLGTGDDLVWPEGHPRLTYPVVDGGPE